jgi:hypothetical protein
MGEGEWWAWRDLNLGLMETSPAIRNLTSDFYFLQLLISQTMLKIAMVEYSRNNQYGIQTQTIDDAKILLKKCNITMFSRILLVRNTRGDWKTKWN